MKKSKILALFVLITFGLTSCSKDKDDDTTEVDGYAANVAQEDAIMSVEEVNISIPGLTATKSPLPVANGNISMEVPSKESFAFPTVGFAVKLSTQTEFTGIYLKLSGATEYYDIPKESLTSARAQGSDTKTEPNLNIVTADPQGNYEVNVQFGADIKPGTFCYEICIYDGNGNISTPQEVCVTVKFFGGNDALVGTWILDNMTSGDSEKLLPGDNFCREYREMCQGTGEFYTVKDCNKVPEINITIEKVGDYTLTITDASANATYQYLNYACEIMEGTKNGRTSIRIEKGQWSYDLDGENAKKLILITTSREETFSDGEVEIEVFPNGIPDLSENILNVSENNFNITFPSGTGDDKIEESYYFSK